MKGLAPELVQFPVSTSGVLGSLISPDISLPDFLSRNLQKTPVSSLASLPVTASQQSIKGHHLPVVSGHCSNGKQEDPESKLGS